MMNRLLDGPPAAAGAESLPAHVARLGALPVSRDPGQVVAAIDAAGLLGRGGAGFPVGRKWRSVAERSAGNAAVLVNGAEGEPLSAKDRTLMALRPHLVVDGALLAANAVGADEIVFYVGGEHAAAGRTMATALRERAGATDVPLRLIAAPATYIAGEESAAVHFVEAGDARPTTTPPRPFERGIGGRPTLVQNVESLGHAALIARFGDGWYREAGRAESRGTALITVTGAPSGGVREIELGTTIEELAAESQLGRGDLQAVLLGGYFGGWREASRAWDLALDPAEIRRTGGAFGCGVVAFLGHDRCGVRATARIIDYVAGQSAAQCGPCVFGLRAIADATARLSSGAAERDDLARIERWSTQLMGRGACRHPDGAVGLVASALTAFGHEFATHQRTGGCSRPAREKAA
jgi:NADH:ubiquinone oxidoreductase subunit F (NADH-binding)